ncbi:uncharacterized protein MELLADRAFT_92015 [Melampsora larici-populina 98AG31]|uniref:Uncharacterized protein n=1 Tax=Melampsora larici-populina (strain 98AG31 / pathotype 3-4-7) TaxID=747676 RepID=F4S180_MELLP|nr:uncharacterized protein MELLADRAFT_92015 [Melampsora larici-populina 98AG31]EGG01518.1 hypothetical protein MELLADRAFT_92015 [Melampsora larici-populina 98AG31]
MLLVEGLLMKDLKTKKIQSRPRSLRYSGSVCQFSVLLAWRWRPSLFPEVSKGCGRQRAALKMRFPTSTYVNAVRMRIRSEIAFQPHPVWLLLIPYPTLPTPIFYICSIPISPPSSPSC